MSSLAPSKRTVATNSLPGDPGRFRWFKRIVASTVGGKFIVALTGWGLTGFVIIHMVGNSQMFAGQDAVNRYAKFLKDLGPFLWVARLALLTIFLLHLGWAVWLTIKSDRARPVPYVHKETVQASVASRFMFQSGLVILAFLVFHLAHFTFGWVKGAEVGEAQWSSAAAAAHDGGSTRKTPPPRVVHYLDLRDAQGRHDVYNMTVFGFREPLIAILYLAAQVFLFLHLSHGVQSAFQSLGWNGPRWQWTTRAVGWAVTLIVVGGNVAIILGVWLGWVRPAGPFFVAG